MRAEGQYPERGGDVRTLEMPGGARIGRQRGRHRGLCQRPGDGAPAVGGAGCEQKHDFDHRGDAAMSYRNLRRPSGMSLIELMIAMLIGMVLILGVVQIFGASRSAYQLSEGM